MAPRMDRDGMKWETAPAHKAAAPSPRKNAAKMRPEIKIASSNKKVIQKMFSLGNLKVTGAKGSCGTRDESARGFSSQDLVCGFQTRRGVSPLSVLSMKS